jgi:4-hydroxy-2-oxoglutarate aldolase
LQNNKTENSLSSADVFAQKLRGILLPLPTPFTDSGDVNESALRANIAKWNTTGIAGHVVLGSTGERVNLDEREYLQIIEVARVAVPSDMVFIAGAGQQSTRNTIDEVKRATAAGADAVLVLTPHFYRSAITQSALVDHYLFVADAARVPVILYSMPALTGIRIEPETVARLSDHPNIIGIKDSSPDIDGLKKTVRLCPASFAVLTGNGTVLRDALDAGACGGILAVGCAVPEICLKVFHAFKAGDNERAVELQAKLTPLAAAVTTRFGIGGLKAALDMKGYVGGAVRAPLRAPAHDAHEEIGTLLEEAEKALYALSAQSAEASLGASSL